MLPEAHREEMVNLSAELLSESAALGALVHPVTREGLRGLLRQMNSYYSNQIEDHYTHPLDIERALRRDFSMEPAKRALQLESFAHVATQEDIEARLAAEPELDICSEAFLCWIHKQFYERMPEEFRVIKGRQGAQAVVAGKLRLDDVEVGDHIPPTFQSVPLFLQRFSEAYRFSKLGSVERVFATGAAHHRLSWIHPFLDGNGRVMRLFSHAWLVRAQIAGHGLWMVSRGLARQREQYKEALSVADEPRRGALDGRGNLSDAGLAAFCVFFLKTAIDQVKFMAGLLELDVLLGRLSSYVELRAARGELDVEAKHLLQEALMRGEVPRGEASRITGLGERTARHLLGQLIAENLLWSKTPKGPLRLGFPPSAVPYYFPRLYPAQVESGLLARTND